MQEISLLVKNKGKRAWSISGSPTAWLGQAVHAAAQPVGPRLGLLQITRTAFSPSGRRQLEQAADSCKRLQLECDGEWRCVGTEAAKGLSLSRNFANGIPISRSSRCQHIWVQLSSPLRTMRNSQ